MLIASVNLLKPTGYAIHQQSYVSASPLCFVFKLEMKPYLVS